MLSLLRKGQWELKEKCKSIHAVALKWMAWFSQEILKAIISNC